MCGAALVAETVKAPAGLTLSAPAAPTLSYPQAVRLAKQASFGPTVELVNHMTAVGLDAWLDGAGEGSPAGVVEIRLRSPDPEDLTLREARLLGSADVLAHEPGVPAAVLDRARADAVRVAIDAAGLAPDGPGLVVVLRA